MQLSYTYSNYREKKNCINLSFFSGCTMLLATLFTLHHNAVSIKTGMSKPAALLEVEIALFTVKWISTAARQDSFIRTHTKIHSRAENCSLSSCHFLTMSSNSGNPARTRSSRSSNASCFKQTGD